MKLPRFERLYQTQNKAIFLQSSSFKFILQVLSSNFYLRASFAKLFNFKLSKSCWKSPKLYKRILAHFEKKWVWHVDFQKFLKKRVSCLGKWAKNDPTYQTSKARIRYVGKDSSFSLAFILRVEESVRFCPFYGAKQFFFQKTLKINAPNSFLQNEPKLFYIILDCFNKFVTTWNWTIWRKKRGYRG